MVLLKIMVHTLLLIGMITATSVVKNRTVWSTAACNSPEIINEAYEVNGNFLCIKQEEMPFTSRNDTTCFEELFTDCLNATQPMPN